MEGEHVYNVPVATKQEERNKDKRETKKIKKKFQKMLDEVSEL